MHSTNISAKSNQDKSENYPLYPAIEVLAITLLSVSSSLTVIAEISLIGLTFSGSDFRWCWCKGGNQLDKLDAAFNFHQSALRLRSERQELLASNIANADTPNYKARDIDFNAALKGAMAGNSSLSLTTTKTSAEHLNGTNQGTAATGGADAPLFRPIVQGAVDGNTVDMDVERNQFTDNAIRYEASLIMLNGSIKKMLTAITGQ